MLRRQEGLHASTVAHPEPSGNHPVGQSALTPEPYVFGDRSPETEAAAQSPDEPLARRHHVQTRANDLLFEAIKETRPEPSEEIARQAIAGAASVIVPIVAALASIAQTPKNKRDYDRSTLAAIMRLRDRIAGASPTRTTAFRP
jgi:hypothetical protein